MEVFRDKQKEFNHINKPTFQERIYRFPGTIHIDSFGIENGNVIYREHANEASEAGELQILKMKAKLYNISLLSG